VFNFTEEVFCCVGSFTAPITPKDKVSLFTLDYVERNNNNFHSELEVNSIVISQKDNLLVIVSLDLIWVDEKFTEKVKEWVSSEYSKYKTHVLLVATHSHSTPQISEKICNSARPSMSYNSFLYDQVCKVISGAFDNREKCYAELSITKPDLTINRRKKILSTNLLKRGIVKTIIANRPNPRGACDDSLYTIWFYDVMGNEKAVLLNYACHTTLFRENAISADFVGLVSNYIKSQSSEKLVVCFLQGFAGNVKANLIKDQCLDYGSVLHYVYNCIFDRFQFNKELSKQEIENFSIKLAKFALLRNNSKRVNPRILFSNKTIKLPLQNSNSMQYANLEISYVSIGNGLRIIALGGEIFCEYSLWLRKVFLSKGIDLLTVGYCNDMVGYIPTFDAMKEGGYEVERSFRIFGHISQFSDKLERIIMKEIFEMVGIDPQIKFK